VGVLFVVQLSATVVSANPKIKGAAAAFVKFRVRALEAAHTAKTRVLRKVTK